MPTSSPSAVSRPAAAHRLTFAAAESGLEDILLDDVDPISQTSFGELVDARLGDGDLFVVVQTGTYPPNSGSRRRSYEARGWADLTRDAAPLFVPLQQQDPVCRLRVEHLHVYLLDSEARPPRLSCLASLTEPRPATFAHWATLSLLDLLSSSPDCRLSGALALSGSPTPPPLPRAAAERTFFRAVVCGQTQAALAALEAGADIEARHGERGMTGLAWATYLGDRELACALLERGASCRPAAEVFCQSPLHNAGLWGDGALMERLIAGGAAASLALPGDGQDDVEGAEARRPAPLPALRADAMQGVQPDDGVWPWAQAWREEARRHPQPNSAERRLWRPVVAAARAVLMAHR